MSDRTARGQTFLLASKKKKKKHTHSSLHLCQPVATAEAERLGGRAAQSIWESPRMQICAPADVPKRGGDRTGNRAETCRAKTGRPPRSSSPPSSVSQSPLPIPAQPSFIFRVFGDERKQLLCTLSKSEWADEREGGSGETEGETEGGKIKKSGSRLDSSGEAGRKQEVRETKKGEWREECRGSVRQREI